MGSTYGGKAYFNQKTLTKAQAKFQKYFGEITI